jgi:enamine deaminase RidA (YjgF/YER057c/UK114 family)
MIESRLQELGLVLPVMPGALANYVPFKIAGGMLYISGQLPMHEGVVQYKGKVGKDISVEQGVDAARLCALNILGVIKHATGGDWSKVKSVVRICGFVNCETNFQDHPKVINGASDLMVDIFQENGRHARAAVGCNSLPKNASVEIEATIELAY